MQRKVILSLIGISLIIGLIVALYLSITIDYRKQIAVDLLSNADGGLNYSHLELLLNEKYMSGVGFEGVIGFVTNYGGACTDIHCRLPISGTFCVIENAIISLQDSEDKIVKVERRLDGC